MTEEPYRWLEAIGNRREYVRDQLKGGSPVLAGCLADGILLLGVSRGLGKVFEIHDRHAMAGLGHPADLERIRQAAIDAAHLEAFTRAAEDVSLRRLVGFGLSAQLKQNFEQLFTAPVLGEFVFAELGTTPGHDLLVRVRFDGTYSVQTGGALVVAADPDEESAAQATLERQWRDSLSLAEAAQQLLETWWLLQTQQTAKEPAPSPEDRAAGWRSATAGAQIEFGWLNRKSSRLARYEVLDLKSLLPTPTT